MFNDWLYFYPLPSPRLDYVEVGDNVLAYKLIRDKTKVCNNKQNRIHVSEFNDIPKDVDNDHSAFIFYPGEGIHFKYQLNNLAIKNHTDAVEGKGEIHNSTFEKLTKPVQKVLSKFTISDDPQSSFHSSLLSLLYGSSTIFPTVMSIFDLRIAILGAVRKLKKLSFDEAKKHYPWLNHVASTSR
jgi:hypothetical protein